MSNGHRTDHCLSRTSQLTANCSVAEQGSILKQEEGGDYITILSDCIYNQYQNLSCTTHVNMAHIEIVMAKLESGAAEQNKTIPVDCRLI